MSIALLANPSIKALYGLSGGGGGSQTLSFNTGTNDLSISGGNTVSLSSLNQGLLWNPVTSTLSIPPIPTGSSSVSLAGLNQSLSFAPTASSSDLTISGGNTVNIDNPQTLTVSGNDLTISRGNTITLPTGSGSPALWSQFPATQAVSFSGYNANGIGTCSANSVNIANPTGNGAFQFGVQNAVTPMPISSLFIVRDVPPGGGNPAGDNLVLESHWLKQDVNPNLNQDYCFRIVHSGNNTWLRTAWEIPTGGVLPANPNPPAVYTIGSVTIDGQPVILTTSTGANGVQIQSTASGWASLYTDTNGNLYQVTTANTGSSWSGGFLIPKTEFGTYGASGANGTATITLTTPFTSASYTVVASSTDTTTGSSISAVATTNSSFDIAWFNAGGGSHNINWIAMGT